MGLLDYWRVDMIIGFLVIDACRLYARTYKNIHNPLTGRMINLIKLISQIEYPPKKKGTDVK